MLKWTNTYNGNCTAQLLIIQPRRLKIGKFKRTLVGESLTERKLYMVGKF